MKTPFAVRVEADLPKTVGDRARQENQALTIADATVLMEPPGVPSSPPGATSKRDRPDAR